MRFFVAGIPAPQGSKRHVGRGVLIESSKALKPWREDIRQTALTALADGGAVMAGPVGVSLCFWLPRPKSHPKTRRTVPTTRPDLDKLARGVLDALTSAGAYNDDSQVVWLVLEKQYVHPVDLATETDPGRPGVDITLTVAPPAELAEPDDDGPDSMNDDHWNDMKEGLR